MLRGIFRLLVLVGEGLGRMIVVIFLLIDGDRWRIVRLLICVRVHWNTQRIRSYVRMHFSNSFIESVVSVVNSDDREEE